ncbi:MAG: FecR domain-containing protein, partial [Deltaproteobacteria bacterium]|nr:FecR domain-containing protein [Deltaproteobacteria bacterium]
MTTCNEVQDELADLVAGDRDAVARHSEHLASCDACRDARHEATELAARVGQAGSDHVSPEDLVARVLAAAAEPAVDRSASIAGPDLATAATVAMETAKAEPAPVKRTPIRKPNRTWLALGAAAALAAGGIGIYKLRSARTDEATTTTTVAVPSAKGSIGTLASVARASSDGSDGVSIKIGDAWRPLKKGEILRAGTTVKTDERTRAGLDLADGTTLVLDHGTELAFDAKEPRALTLTAGRLSADIAHVENHPASIATRSGTIEVIGTKFVVATTDTLTSVQVVRGSVALTATGSGKREQINAGEEGLIENGALSVGAAPSLAAELGWSELDGKPKAADETTAGLGALRAYKPGEKRDRDWKLALAKHDVKVRISGPIARTEITETFRNDSDVTLEGVYQFPLPADAQIDGLSLDMADQPTGFIDGAFVAKTRAAKIWQGVIDKASPMQIARPSSEIIWVPGRWKDPALLDWKRGGRFELKIYPIPAKGARTIKLSYTQVVTARGPFRQYVYPLAHSVDGSTVADNFTVDLEVRGALPGLVRTVGYQMTPDVNRSNVNALTMTSSAFVPKGDLVVDYRATDGDAELRAWTFTGGAAVGPDEKLSTKKDVGIDPKVIEAQRVVAADARPTAVLALRPALPRWRETKPRDFVIVVDSSQSMVGERFTRATELTLGLIEQMDRRDRFTVAACDSECRRMGDLRAPSEAAGKDSRTWLSSLTPAGASDVVTSIRSAAEFEGSDREKWILYIGDGFATTGFRRVADVERALTEVADKGVQVTTIGIGGDADLALLAAAARGGGGTYLAYVPGQSVEIAALAALESTNGASLRNATIELPSGLADVAPTVLPTVRAGEEVLIAARINGEIKGDVIVRGMVGGQPFEQKYPLKLDVSTSAGNGFVPRLWATLAIEQMERSGEGNDKTKTIALSQAYGVMSRETSLLVLESAAMFEAFGVDRTQQAAKWTGEEQLDETITAGTIAMDKNAGAPTDSGTVTGAGGTGAAEAKSEEKPEPERDMATDGKRSERPAPTATAAKPATPRTAADPAPPPPPMKVTTRSKGPGGGGAMADDFGGGFGAGMGRGSNMVAMRRTWVRVPAVSAYEG